MKKAVVFLLLAGCSTVQPTSIGIPFNPAEVAWFDVAGTNSIHGSAVMRTVGGDVRTCAGLDANIVPDSSYARARMQAVYGNLDRGFNPATSGFQFAETPPAYLRESRTVTCDPQGFFAFTGLPDGDYFVTAKIVWGVRNRYFTEWQGGYLMQRVSLRGGETKEVVLSR